MKTLIISPHADDEVYGAFSFLKDAFVVYCGLDESACPKDDDHRLSAKAKIAEVNDVAYFCKFIWRDLNRTVNKFAIYDPIPKIEEYINLVKPDVILIPHPSTNQDHEVVYKACLVALRQHDKNYWVKKVLVYECPGSFFGFNKMEANYYRPVDMLRKIKAYNLYWSQKRSYRSEAHIRHMGSGRGYESDLPYAEAFKVLRWIE